MRKILILLVLLFQASVAFAVAKEEAQLIYYEGKVEAKRAQKEEWEDVKLNMMLYPKDRVKTRLQSKAELRLPDDSIFDIGENTIFDIQKLYVDKNSSVKNYSFKLFVGDLVGKIEKLKKGDTFEIETPVALVGFRGTTVLVRVKPNGETWVGMKSGRGYVRSVKTGGEQIIEENKYFSVGADGAFTGSGVLSGSELEHFENLEKSKDGVIKTMNLEEDTSPPVIKITTSEFGKKVTNDRNLRIVGVVTDKPAGGKNLKFFVNGQGVRLIAGIVNTSYILKEGENVLEFRAVDEAGNEGRETKTIYLDSRPPNLLSLSITPDPVNLEGSVEILIEAEDGFSDMEKNTTLTLYNPRGESYKLTAPYDYTTKKYVLVVRPSEYLGQMAEGMWKVSIELQDGLGNKSMKYFREFRVTDLPPSPPGNRR